MGDRTLIARSGEIVSGENIGTAIQQKLQAANDNTAFHFIVQPLDKGEELSNLLNRAGAEPNHCAGSCD